MKTHRILILSLLLFTEFTWAQNDYTIYRSYRTRLGEKEELSFEYIDDKKNDLQVTKTFNLPQWFDYSYVSGGKTIAFVILQDSFYYEYTKNNSAILYCFHGGQNIKLATDFFNQRQNLILSLGYHSNTDKVSNYSRSTYMADTLMIGTANYSLSLWDGIDTTLIDTTFYTYDELGRKTGYYPLTRELEMDTSFVTEYTYQDTLETTWEYDCEKRPCKKYARLIETYSADQHILEQKYYNVNGELEEVVKYTYVPADDNKKHQNTASIIHYSADGHITEKTTFREEIIKK